MAEWYGRTTWMVEKSLSQWYWIMSNAVLFSKELTDKQKLLYCLISSLCAEKWYCRATNEYIWELLNADKWTISKNVSALNEKWFIYVDVDQNFKRKISLVKNDKGDSQKWLWGDSQKWLHNITTTNTTNEKGFSFQDFRAEYPHARKWKKKESEKYFNQNDSSSVKKQVSILKRLIKAWLQDSEYVPACERRIRDFTPLSEDVIKQKLEKICRRHLNAWWDMKQRSLELKETFGEQQINEIVKKVQNNKITLSLT